jgi:hypothetical protein
MPRSDPAQFAAAVVSRLATALRPAMDSLGEDMQAEMRQLISVPVQYVDPDGGSRPAKPAESGSRPGPGLTFRDKGSPGIYHTTVGGKLKRVVRSVPGEAPRKEFGLLYKSMVTRTVVGRDRISTFLESDPDIADYSVYLEDKLNRPHFETIFERVQRYAVDRIRSRLPNQI